MTETKSDPGSRNVLLALLLISLAGIGAVIYLIAKPGEEKQEAIVSVMEAPTPAAAEINVMDVIDAIENREVTAAEGQRYKVLVTDEAREGASGITRIGGLVTFVPNTRPGDVAIIEVTRLKRSTADSVVIEKLESGRPVPQRAERADRPPREDRQTAPSEIVGKTFRGTITGTGREGDGVTHVNGKVVFVAGASEGEHVEFIITEDAGRFARAEVVSKSETPVPAEAQPERAPRERDASAPATESAVAPVQSGEEHEVTITEDDRRNPGVNGVARINNFVIFVPDTKVGERVRIRITDVRARAANAEVLERPGAAEATP